MGTLSLVTKKFYSEIKMMKLLISTLLVLIVSTFADEEVINWTAKEYASIVLHGDEKVVFSFTANHDLYQFNNKNAYTNCNFNNAVLIEEGPAEVEISGDEETKYFGCSVSTHCSISGQKIELEWHDDHDDKEAHDDEHDDAGANLFASVAVAFATFAVVLLF